VKRNEATAGKRSEVKRSKETTRPQKSGKERKPTRKEFST